AATSPAGAVDSTGPGACCLLPAISLPSSCPQHIPSPPRLTFDVCRLPLDPSPITHYASRIPYHLAPQPDHLTPILHPADRNRIRLRRLLIRQPVPRSVGTIRQHHISDRCLNRVQRVLGILLRPPAGRRIGHKHMHQQRRLRVPARPKAASLPLHRPAAHHHHRRLPLKIAHLVAVHRLGRLPAPHQ